MAGRRVLVTRPEPGLSETMAVLRARGFAPVACPMLTITHRMPSLASRMVDAILITSGQAVPGLEKLRGAGRVDANVPVFAVGDRSAARTRAAGFVRVESASGTAAYLVTHVRLAFPAGARLLVLSGQGEGQALALACRSAGFRVSRRVAYAARPVARVPDAVWTAWAGAPHAAVFLSAATARAFMAAVPTSRLPTLRHACAVALSANVARDVQPGLWGAVRIAPHPDMAGILHALAEA